jgi:hypothetical protein
MKIALGYEFWMVLASAVGADVALAIWAGMVVAPLTNLGAARILSAEGTSRVVEHPLRQCLFLVKGFPKGIFFLRGTRREALIAALMLRVAIVRTTALIASVVVLTLRIPILVLEPSICASGPARLRFTASNVSAGAGDLTAYNQLVMM